MMYEHAVREDDHDDDGQGSHDASAYLALFLGGPMLWACRAAHYLRPAPESDEPPDYVRVPSRVDPSVAFVWLSDRRDLLPRVAAWAHEERAEARLSQELDSGAQDHVIAVRCGEAVGMGSLANDGRISVVLAPGESGVREALVTRAEDLARERGPERVSATAPDDSRRVPVRVPQGGRGAAAQTPMTAPA